MKAKVRKFTKTHIVSAVLLKIKNITFSTGSENIMFTIRSSHSPAGTQPLSLLISQHIAPQVLKKGSCSCTHHEGIQEEWRYSSAQS
jgi:hypothetical protein